ncbi:MAG: hypothetical protein OXI92_11720, partial [Acidobacteriota bacterium]|nr:hypothetical protein [Acidobacteriota bacterium]
DHSRVKQRIFIACREQGPGCVGTIFYQMNIDAQDAQDIQDSFQETASVSCRESAKPHRIIA